MLLHRKNIASKKTYIIAAAIFIIFIIMIAFFVSRFLSAEIANDSFGVEYFDLSYKELIQDGDLSDPVIREASVGVADGQELLAAYRYEDDGGYEYFSAKAKYLPVIHDDESLSLYGIRADALSERPLMSDIAVSDSCTVGFDEYEGFALVKESPVITPEKSKIPEKFN